MSLSGSSAFTNGYEEDPIFQKSHYTQDISEQMRVPKRIKATGEYYDDYDLPAMNGNADHWSYRDKINMTVPDRIMVMGEGQVMGTRTAPREIMLDNSILQQQDPNPVRISTPPRAITLNDHPFPTASDDQYSPENGPVIAREYDQSSIGSIENTPLTINKPKRIVPNDYFSASREATPPLAYGDVNATDEVIHLRRQISKLNRRMLALEIDNMQRQHREKIACCLGLAYFLMKTIMWLNRN